MHRGYLALWRKLSDHPFWKEKREFSKAEAWIDILWEVQHKEEPQEVLLGMTCLICNYGESLKSLETWSKRWGWNKSRVRRFLHLLENMAQIRHSSERKTTRITVLNYSQYDPRRNAIDTQVKRKRNDSETIATPDKNVKKDKNVYGAFKNVLLSEKEAKELEKRFNGTMDTKIEALSEYMKSKGKRYKSHYATILSWDRRDKKDKPKTDEWGRPC